MGILVLMMSLAGQVFNITVQSTGQATAYTEIMQQLRAFEQTIREDLRGVQPGNSLILIQGNPVNAYWTENGRDADIDAGVANAGPATGYPHAADPERENAAGNGDPVMPRADILMVFTARPGLSYVETGTLPLTSNLQQVVYGHAELGEYVTSEVANERYKFERSTGDAPYFPEDNGYPSPSRVAPMAAAQWLLARRSVLLLPTPPPSTGLSWEAIKTPSEQGVGLGRKEILEGAVDVVGDFRYEDIALYPVDPTTNWGSQDPWFPPSVFGNTRNMPFRDWHNPYARSRLDPAPPALFANRIGHYLLPNCASFKVEWTLNPRSEFVAGRLDRANEVFWFDPGDPVDPLRSLAEAAKNATGTAKQPLECLLGTRANGAPIDECRPVHPDGLAYSLSDRFRGPAFPGANPDYAWKQLAPDGRRPNLVVFTAIRPNASGSEPVLDPMFPAALRITVDVYDRERRLERPIRHVMTIPIGG